MGLYVSNAMEMNEAEARRMYLDLSSPPFLPSSLRRRSVGGQTFAFGHSFDKRRDFEHRFFCERLMCACLEKSADPYASGVSRGG